MWKSLNPGEKVLKGDTIRYKTDPTNPSPSKDEIYYVTKVDLHYFEIALSPDNEDNPEQDRKIIKYMDVGYHLGMETWFDQLQVLTDSSNHVTGNQTEAPF